MTILTTCLFLLLTASVTIAMQECGDDAPSAIVSQPQTAEDLLELLEKDGASLNDFRANIRVEKIEPVLGDKEWNTGEVFLHFDHANDVKRFVLHFIRKGDNRTARDRNEEYVFDGAWLVEKQIEPNRKQFIARRMVPPGQQMDALKLGEGPIPLPIAQKKDDVLARFDAELIGHPDDPDSTLTKTLKDVEVYGLKLIPKPGFPEADDFKSVEIWFDQKTLLPVGVDVDSDEDGRTIVWMWNIVRNEGVDVDMFDTTPPGPGDGWDVDIQDWDDSSL